MAYLVSHLWLLYLLSLILAGIAYAVIDISDLSIGDFILSAIYAAIPELIAISSIYFYRKGYLILAVIVAVLCCIAAAAAVLLFFVTAKSSTYAHIPSIITGIISGILGVVSCILCRFSFAGNTTQIILTSCCLCGMISVAYMIGYLTAFGKGMGGP
ncbi:hypothetical protein [Ruminococcus flavefaciens]|uniref:Uncharacterized protein n=1 Tax=Ruminococcus flavefaciens TaxID=1265 RepID=A0A1M7IE08_RUMFL|nr:hypothetical protein [Ruminococcus flavefaciens]SHM38994.1 hypothetical protein SAMN04487860_10465 [Ruminococcus flavefaciens]